MFGLSSYKEYFWEQGKIKEAIALTRTEMSQAPRLRFFFLHQRQSGSQYHDDIKRLEENFLKRIRNSSPHVRTEFLQGVYAMCFGAAILYDLPKEALDAIGIGIETVLNSKKTR